MASRGVSPPPGPPDDAQLGFCFGCLTGTCPHVTGSLAAAGIRPACQEYGGYTPAITAFEGTPLCQDCAVAASRTVIRRAT